jgi:hypothetical protein
MNIHTDDFRAMCWEMQLKAGKSKQGNWEFCNGEGCEGCGEKCKWEFDFWD